MSNNVTKEKQVKLFFDPVEHKYTDDENNVYTSVTTLIGKYEPPYPSQYWAVYRALDQTGFRLVPSPETQTIKVVGKNGITLNTNAQALFKFIQEGKIVTKKTPLEIQTEWEKEAEEACLIGTEKHDYLEECINKFYAETKTEVNKTDDTNSTASKGFKFKIKTIKELDDSPLKLTDPEIYNLLVRYLKNGFTLYAEKRVYSYFYKVSGTIDVLAIKGKEFVIIDWKTNKHELKFNSGYYKKTWNADRTEKVKTKTWVSTSAKMLKPIHHLPHCKGTVYSLQLSIYAHLVERWGYTCTGLVLCHLLKVRNPRKKNKFYSISYHKKEAISMLDDNKDRSNSVFRSAIR